MHKMLLDEIVLVCKRIEAEGDNQISKSFSKEMLENCVIEQDRQLEAAKHDRDGAVEQYLESQKALRAAKQRELELLAVIDLLNDGLKESLGKYQSDVSDSIDSAISKADGIDFTALREHEAKVLEDLAGDLADAGYADSLILKIMDVAEERRKK